jgi:hypothetical protein
MSRREETDMAGMAAEDLARFTAEARRLFRGEWEEDIWSISLPRIKRLRPSLAMAALTDYASEYGGGRGRFIVGKFFEYVARLTASDASERADAKRLAESEMAFIAARDERKRIAAEWEACRETIRRAGPATRSNAINGLLAAGWPKPPDDLTKWKRSWLLAVSDIVSGRGTLEFYAGLAHAFPH